MAGGTARLVLLCMLPTWKFELKRLFELQGTFGNFKSTVIGWVFFLPKKGHKLLHILRCQFNAISFLWVFSTLTYYFSK